MIRELINKTADWLEDGLRRVISPLSPDGRVIVILTMFVLFGGLSIYMTVSSIYNFGKDKGRRIEIERIESVRLESASQTEREPERDSINNNLNEFEYGTAEQ